MTITFSMTGRELVTRAMNERRVLALGESPTAEELDYGIQTANLFVKSLGARGITPWTEVEGSATATAGTATVTLTPRPLGVGEARLELSANYQRPLTFLETGEYLEYPNKAQPGEPLVFTLRRAIDGISMVFWPVPIVNRTIRYTYARVIEDVTPDLPVDMPQMWTEAVAKILAFKMSAFADPPHIQQLAGEAASLEQQLSDFDRPASYMIGAVC